MKTIFRTLLAIGFLSLLAHGALADDVVRAAQVKLQKMGYYDGSLDGRWGSQTAAAVRRFQLAEDLRVTGELNRETLTELQINAEPIATPVPKYVALADLFVGGPYLTAPPEFQVKTVRQAQKNLKLLKFYTGPVNGNPSEQLQAALRAYQKSNRFKATGRLDKTTLQALNLLTLPY